MSVQLLKYSENKFQTCPITETIKKVPDIIVVSVCGPSRSGKSFLLNEIGGCDFSVSDTTISKTKGLWVSLHSVGNKNYLFVDTEGFDSLDLNESFDAKIMFLTLFLSSVFVFNKRGLLDQKNLSFLE
jgi:hypothetical protein